MKTMTMKLCGRVCRDRRSKLTNQEKYELMKEHVEHYFPSGIHVFDQDRLLNEGYPYPEYFAAGWVVKEFVDTTKQTVIVAHGSSLIEATKKLNGLITKINWG